MAVAARCLLTPAFQQGNMFPADRQYCLCTPPPLEAAGGSRAITQHPWLKSSTRSLSFPRSPTTRHLLPPPPALAPPEPPPLPPASPPLPTAGRHVPPPAHAPQLSQSLPTPQIATATGPRCARRASRGRHGPGLRPMEGGMRTVQTQKWRRWQRPFLCAPHGGGWLAAGCDRLWAVSLAVAASGHSRRAQRCQCMMRIAV